jgi:hypothetical protein
MKRIAERLLMAVCGWMLLCCASVEAGIYQWVDEDGKVHFSDRPGAAEGAEEVTVKQDKGASKSATGEAERAQTRQRLLEQYEKERLEKKAAAQQRKAEQARRKRNCAIAKDRLSSYEKSVLYDIGPDGERIYLSGDEHERALAEAREDVRYWCD